MSTAEPTAEFEPYPERFAGPYAPATARELKGLMKHWRTGRATRNLLEAISDAYVALIGAVMIGAMVVNVVVQAQDQVSTSCLATACQTARTVLPWASFAVAIAASLAVSRLFGPVLASAAEGFWLMDGPIRRSQLLAGRLATAVVAAFVIGGILGGLVAALSGSAWMTVIVWVVATGLAASAAVAFAAALQEAEHTLPTKIIGGFFWLAAIAALVAAIGVAADWFTLTISNQTDVQFAAYLGAGAVVVLVVAVIVAATRLNSIRRVRLLSGGSLVTSLQGAFFALDIGLARDIVVERRAAEIGNVRPKKGRGLGLQAITWRELQRLARFPQPLVAVAATLVVPYAADALGLSRLTPVVSGLALFGATIPLLGGLRVLTRTGGLARCLPFSVSQIKLASVAVPGIICAVWAIAATAAFTGFGSGTRVPVTDAFFFALLTAAGGFLGAIRWTQAKTIDFGAPMVSTQAGAFPPGLMTNLFRGFDVCLLITAPLLLPFQHAGIISFVIAGIAALILLGSFNSEDMRARQAEQQKLLDDAKAARRR